MRHLPILDREVIIRIRPIRYECPECDDHPTTTQQLDWYDKKSSCTKAYSDYLMRRLFKSNLKNVCHKENLTYKILVRIVEKKIQDKVDWGRYSKLDIIGLGEIALKKGYQDYVVIVSAKINGQLFVLQP